MTAHLDQVSGLVQALSSELRSGIGPAADSLLAFVRAVDWTVPPIPLVDHRQFLLLPPTVSSSSLELTIRMRASRFQEPWLMCLMAFHASLLMATIGLRRNANLQFFLLFLACEFYCLLRFYPRVSSLGQTKYELSPEEGVLASNHSNFCLILSLVLFHSTSLGKHIV